MTPIPVYIDYGIVIAFIVFVFFAFMAIGGFHSIRSFIDDRLEKTFSENERHKRRITSALEARHRQESERIYDFTEWKGK